jgi:hypothetical protein
MRGSEARDFVYWFCGTFKDPWNIVFTAEKGKFVKGGGILVKKANHGCSRGVTRSVDSLQHQFNTRLNISRWFKYFNTQEEPAIITGHLHKRWVM